MKSLFIVTLLTTALLLTGCTQSPIQMLDNIVRSAEAIIPLIPGVPAADAALITGYADSVLSIANDLTTVSPDSITQAISDFRRLAVPQLSKSVSPGTIGAVNSISAGVSAFISAYEGTVLTSDAFRVAGVSSFAEPAKTKKLKPLSEKDQKKLAEIKARAQAARAKLRAVKK